MSDKDDVIIPLFTGDVVQDVHMVIDKTSEWTKPDLSLTFIIFFAIIAIFHESHFEYVAPLLASWIILQAWSLLHGEQNIFWAFVHLFQQAVFYLIIGYLWSLAKLYIDVWQGHFDPLQLEVMRQCVAPANVQLSCITDILQSIKWYILRSMLTWPASILYTLSRDPLNIFLELTFEWSKKRYMWIIQSALSNPNSNDGWVLIRFILGVVIYFLIGYTWTHVKLFLDVWQGTLPREMDLAVRKCYTSQTSYMNFVIQIKWLVLQWLFTWPLSMLYYLLQHPVRIIAEFIYHMSQRKYAQVIGLAMSWRHQKDE